MSTQVTYERPTREPDAARPYLGSTIHFWFCGGSICGCYNGYHNVTYYSKCGPNYWTYDSLNSVGDLSSISFMNLLDDVMYQKLIDDSIAGAS